MCLNSSINTGFGKRQVSSSAVVPGRCGLPRLFRPSRHRPVAGGPTNNSDYAGPVFPLPTPPPLGEHGVDPLSDFLAALPRRAGLVEVVGNRLFAILEGIFQKQFAVFLPIPRSWQPPDSCGTAVAGRGEERMIFRF